MHQVLNPWLPGLFFINVKHRLLIIALNSVSIIFACLYGKSQGISCGLESGHPEVNLTELDRPAKSLVSVKCK